MGTFHIPLKSVVAFPVKITVHQAGKLIAQFTQVNYRRTWAIRIGSLWFIILCGPILVSGSQAEYSRPPYLWCGSEYLSQHGTSPTTGGPHWISWTWPEVTHKSILHIASPCLRRPLRFFWHALPIVSRAPCGFDYQQKSVSAGGLGIDTEGLLYNYLELLWRSIYDCWIMYIVSV